MDKLNDDIINLIAEYCDNLCGISNKIQSMLFLKKCSVYGKITPFTRRVVCWNIKYIDMCKQCQIDIDEAEEAMSQSMKRIEEENEYIAINFI